MTNNIDSTNQEIQTSFQEVAVKNMVGQLAEAAREHSRAATVEQSSLIIEAEMKKAMVDGFMDGLEDVKKLIVQTHSEYTSKLASNILDTQKSLKELNQLSLPPVDIKFRSLEMAKQELLEKESGMKTIDTTTVDKLRDL